MSASLSDTARLDDPAIALVVDLDGTLVHTDTLHEAALRLVAERPLALPLLPLWLTRGKAVLKREIASRVRLDATTLSYNEPLLAWLREERARGRRLVLCTASDESTARAVAAHLGLFDEVMASDGHTNLAGQHKADALAQRFGRAGFDYAGNSRHDLAVWSVARRAVVVSASTALATAAAERCAVERVFTPAPARRDDWRRVFRFHQWPKNLLLAVPLAAAHQLGHLAAWGTLALAFLAFGAVASALYIVNDLLDLASDRVHPRKRDRPFASGRVPVAWGVALVPPLLLSGALLASLVGPGFAMWLLAYALLTGAYTMGIKRLALLDCLTLALLFTVRVVAGAAAVAVPLSFWLLAFSMFFFLSLAFVKRYAELLVQQEAGQDHAPGRGYATADAPLVQTLGVAAGFAAVVVLALYINSEAVLRLYRMPWLLWAAVPVLLFWLSWMWLQAHRGRMHDDPLVFALKNPVSLGAGAAFAVVLAIGALGGA